jgi:hypothetical protein
MGSSSDAIWKENAADSILAHVLVGEPDSTSPEHALAAALFRVEAVRSGTEPHILSLRWRILDRIPHIGEAILAHWRDQR